MISEETKIAHIENYLATIIASKLGSTPEAIDREEPFTPLGVDSIIMPEVMSELEKKYDHLSPTLMYEYANIRQLANYLKDKTPKGGEEKPSKTLDKEIPNDNQKDNQKAPEMVAPQRNYPAPEGISPLYQEASSSGGENFPEKETPPDGESFTFKEINLFSDDYGEQNDLRQASTPLSTGATQPQAPQPSLIPQRGYEIAVIGMSGRFPKSPDLATYWKNLIEGKDCIEEIPRDRWDHDRYFDTDPTKANKSYGKWGGFINDVDKFDPLFFNISPKEAEQMDPQQRLLLECIWETMEHAGYGDRNQYKDKLVGLFAGMMWNEYSLIANQGGFLKDQYWGPGSIYWAVANRVSYVMDFKGPSIALDTACSSSLVAVHLACHSILRGDCDMAIASGVNLSIHPSKYIYLSQAGFLSKDGRCRSFGEGGTGYVPGEGVGAVLLKPLDKAIQDGDHIYGIIRGSSINHGGKVTGFTVPNPEAHTRLIIKAFECAHISPDQLGYIECHGTGTSLGDPIEIVGLSQAFRKYPGTGISNGEKQSCPIGSVKSNIGHLEAAAGVAALIKVLLCMEHSQIPKSLHSEIKNPNIRFEETPFYVVNETMDWVSTPARPKLAGISSFGAGGSNAHLVVESFEGRRDSRGYDSTGYDSTGYEKQNSQLQGSQIHDPQLVVLSAKNEKRLKDYARKMVDFLEREFNEQVKEIPESQAGEGELQPGERELQQELLRTVSDILTVDAEKISLDADIRDYGFDPVHASALINQINEKYGIGLHMPVFFEYPAIESLARYLCQEYQNTFARKESDITRGPEATGESKDNREPEAVRKSAVTLPEIAYTLQVGREAMEERIALVVSDIGDLREKLTQYCQGNTDIENFYHGNVRAKKTKSEPLVAGEEGREFLRIIIEKRKLGKMAQLWVSGVVIDWNLLYPAHNPGRIALPAYPFARDRYWIPNADKVTLDSAVLVNAPGQVLKLHPLVDQNTSTLQEERFSTLLTGGEFYLEDHRVNGKKTLPGVAFIEMARAAGEIAGERKVKKVKNIVWSRPVTVAEASQEVHISLYPNQESVDYEVSTDDVHADATTGAVARDGGNQRVIHAQGKIVYGGRNDNQAGAERIDLEAIKKRCSSNREAAEWYRLFQEKGLKYGPSFQVIQKLWSNGTEALSFLRLSSHSGNAFGGFVLHPSLMDGALQTVMGLLDNSGANAGGLYLPFALGEVELLKSLQETCYAYVTIKGNRNAQGASQVQRFDILLVDETGRILVKMSDFSLRAFQQHPKLVGSTTQPAEAATQSEAGKVMYYHSVWEKSEINLNPLSQDLSGHVLIFDTNEDVRNALRKKQQGKEEAHSQVILVKPGQGFKETGDHLDAGDLVYEINPGRKADYFQLMESLKHQDMIPGTVIHLWSKDLIAGTGETLHSQLEGGVYSVLYLDQAIMEQKPKDRITILYVYVSSPDQPQPQYAALSGFARTIHRENPKYAHKIIEIQTPSLASSLVPSSLTLTPSALPLSQMLDILVREARSEAENEVEIRYTVEQAGEQGKQRWVKNLLEFDLEAEAAKGKTKPAAVSLRERGVYVITGGAGGLGLIFAEYLARQVKARLVLSGRSELSPAKNTQIKELESFGAEVIYIKADVTKREDAQRLIAEARARFKEIQGIFHCAGVIRDSYIAKKTKEEMDAVLAPKVYGTVYLDEASNSVSGAGSGAGAENLDFFVLFSSITAVMGNAGQCDYAYGNSFMDNFAAMREDLRAKGERSGKTLSINWPLWKEGGMRIDEQTEMWMRKRMGLSTLKTENGLKAFENALVSDIEQVAVAEGERDTLNKWLGVQPSVESAPKPASKPAPKADASQPVSKDGLQDKIEKDLIQLLAELLKVKISDLDTEVDLSEYGMDSILMMSVLNRIESMYGDTVEPNALAEYPTIKSFAAYLIEQGIVKPETAQKPAQAIAQGDEQDTNRPSPSKEDRSQSVSKSGLQDKVEKDLIRLLAELLKVKTSDLDTEVDLSEYGMDSILMMSVLNRIESMYGDTVEPNALAEYPTVKSFATYLIEQGIVKPEIAIEKKHIINNSVETPPSIETPLQKDRGERDRRERSRWLVQPRDKVITSPKTEVKKIAVIGMACRFPQSDNLESFWDNVLRGNNLVTEVPEERWKVTDFYSPDRKASNKTYSKWGGFIHGIDLFDAEFFGVSDHDALLMDPQHRLLLELAQELFDRTGYGKEDINHTKTGVFIGGAESSYVRKNMDKIPEGYTKHMLISTIQNMMSARISDFYNLTGPSQTIDTACSSSLVAVHQACQNIRNGECEMAIAGGIELLIDPFYFIGFSKAEVLSDEGTSYVFDERAKGIVLGEGVGLVLMKSYEKAIMDGDRILGVILGSAVNNDGHTMGLTVPSLEGQKEVIHQAIRNSEINPDSISYLEAHGTGTLLGDPIEIKATTQVYQEYTQDKQFCAVGSVKSNMGHLLHASGIASFIKVILALHHKQIPATLHCDRPHPRFKFEISPFYPITEARGWVQRRDIRRAAVSSFGFGGTNCHLIAEELNKEKNEYVPRKKPMPLTHFKRKRFWLGKPVLDVKEAFLKKIFDQFSKGLISKDEAKRQMQMMELSFN